MNWLELNKEWVFSGAGLFVISSITSLFSILITLWWRSKQEKKKIKWLEVDKELTKFSISSPTKVSSDDIKTSYKGKEYENLCLYTVELTNIGFVSIESQCLHIVIPNEGKVIDKIEYKTLESMGIYYKEITSIKRSEYIHEIKRIENNDSYKISYIIDIKDISSIKYHLRGVDNIKYIDKKNINIETSQLNYLVIYIALFIVVDMVPVISSLLKGAIIIAAVPIVFDFIKKYIRFKNNPVNINNTIMFNDTADSKITIQQNNNNN